MSELPTPVVRGLLRMSGKHAVPLTVRVSSNDALDTETAVCRLLYAELRAKDRSLPAASFKPDYEVQCVKVVPRAKS